MDYLLNLIIIILFYTCVAQVLSVYFHYTKKINFATLAFAGVLIYLLNLNLNSLILLLIISLTTILVAVYLNQVQEKYFTISTLLLGLLSYELFVNFELVTQGMQGLFLQKSQTISTFSILIALTVLTFFTYKLETFFAKTNLANTLKFITDNEKIVKMYGHNTRQISIFFFCATTFLFALLCVPYFYHLNYIHPSNFGLTEIFTILTISMLANSPKTVENFYAAAFIILIPEIFSFIPALKILGPELKQLFSAATMLYIIYAKNN